MHTTAQHLDAIDAFHRQGFAVFADVIEPTLLERVRRTCKRILDRTPPEHYGSFPYHGSMISVPHWHTSFTELIAHQSAIDIMRTLGFTDPKWVSGYIISKPAGCLPLWWHQDWWAWDEPLSAAEAVPYAFFMYYLVDTTPWNGCLRVIPGSHRCRIDLHAQLPAAHTPEINACSLESSAHALRSDEESVAVHAGDLVVGDARLLHAAHANRSRERRTCITLWYAPHFSALPNVLRAKLAEQRAVSNGGGRYRRAEKRLAMLLPEYSGPMVKAAPYNPIPGVHLRM